jgi:uncharacterized protein (TIGR00255 family)
MALSSMTGFAQHQGADDGVTWAWELRSVNGRGLDVRVRVPPGYEACEVMARQEVTQQLKRGNVQASLAVNGAAEAQAVIVNRNALEQVTQLAEDLRKRLGGPPLQAEALLALRGVLEAPQPQMAEALPEARAAALSRSLELAVKSLRAMREAEGARLSTIIESQLDRIEILTRNARDNPARSVDAVRQRLKEQVGRLLETGADFDPQRLHQEAALIATRADIQEEIDRLFAHVAAARAILASGEPAGRKLEFLAQEFNREANTLCSKAQEATLTATGLDLKSVIDQLREQILNVE